MGDLCFRAEEPKSESPGPPGVAVVSFANGDEYRGGRLGSPALNKAGQRDGFGTYVFANQDRYEGHWVEDKKDGLGTFFYANGEVYKGQW